MHVDITSAWLLLISFSFFTLDPERVEHDCELRWIRRNLKRHWDELSNFWSARMRTKQSIGLKWSVLNKSMKMRSFVSASFSLRTRFPRLYFLNSSCWTATRTKPGWRKQRVKICRFFWATVWVSFERNGHLMSTRRNWLNTRRKTRIERVRR